MQVQVNSNNHVRGSEELTQDVESTVKNALARFESWITRVEVQISDENSDKKGGEPDKKCVMEARPAGRSPIAASHIGRSVGEAISGCVKKLERILNDTAEKLGHTKGRASMGDIID